MARLSKPELKENKRLEALLKLDRPLTRDEVIDFYTNYNEMGVMDVTGNAAFYTSVQMAHEFCTDLGIDTMYAHNHYLKDVKGIDRRYKVLDLCAGFGVLSWAIADANHYHESVEITCVEINYAAIEIGKKLLPSARWIQGDLSDPELIQQLKNERFDLVISNPPYGKVSTMRDVVGPKYTGAEGEYKVIDIAASICSTGGFIIPQQSCPFRVTGVRDYKKQETTKHAKFKEQTGIRLEAGAGFDTSKMDGFRNTSIIVEFAHYDLEEEY